MAHYSTTEFRNESLLEPEMVALAARLKDIERNQAPPFTLAFPAVLAELSVATNSARAGRIMESKEDRKSLRNDLASSIDALGPRFAEEVKLTLEPLKAEFPRLPTLLGDPAGAQRLEGIVENVRERCESVAVVEAAWADTVEAFHGDGEADLCEFRVLQLAEVVNHRGGNWDQLHSRLASIVNNDLRSIEPIFDGDLPTKDKEHELAGLSVGERIALCAKVLGELPESGNLTVWLGFQNALLHQQYLKIGPVEFFTGQVWPEAIEEGWPHQDETIKEEFEAENLGLFWGENPPDLPFVLCRVKLGEYTIGGGVERARRLTRDLIRAAKPGSEWRMLSGGAAYVKGRGWWGSPLQEAYVTTTDRFSPEFEPTADELERLQSAVVERLRDGDPNLHAAVSDIDWAERVSALKDKTQKVALSVRLLERLLPIAPGEHWTAAACHYMVDIWCKLQIAQSVSEVGHNAVAVVEFHAPVIGWQQPWRNRLLPHQARSYRIEYEEIIRALPELIELAPPYKLASRTIAGLARRFESPETVLAWKAELTDGFQQLIERVARQRNQILHGADTSPQAIASIERFLEWLQSQLALDALGAAEERMSPAVRLEGRRNHVRSCWAEVEAGKDPVEVLFGNAA
jgi:hypothetical protein